MVHLNCMSKDNAVTKVLCLSTWRGARGSELYEVEPNGAKPGETECYAGRRDFACPFIKGVLSALGRQLSLDYPTDLFATKGILSL